MEMLYRLSYVGAHDGDHPSGQHGLDAVRAMVSDRPMREGFASPGVCEEKTHHPEGDSLGKSSWGVARNGESSAPSGARQPETVKKSSLAPPGRDG